MTKAAFMLVIIASLPGCYPITVSAKCQKQIDSCLANCPRREVDPTVGSPAMDDDNRSDCERRCHHICTD